jgi:hypothetical protein
MKPGSAAVLPVHTIGAVLLAVGVMYYASSTAKQQHQLKKQEYRKLKQEKQHQGKDL